MQLGLPNDLQMLNDESWQLVLGSKGQSSRSPVTKNSAVVGLCILLGAGFSLLSCIIVIQRAH